MTKVIYRWWPISVGWAHDSKTLLQQISLAIESRFWTMSWPHRFKCQGALDVHRRACLRMWHGWPIDGSPNEYGRTLHIGRLKVFFGRRGR